MAASSVPALGFNTASCARTRMSCPKNVQACTCVLTLRTLDMGVPSLHVATLGSLMYNLMLVAGAAVMAGDSYNLRLQSVVMLNHRGV